MIPAKRTAKVPDLTRGPRLRSCLRGTRETYPKSWLAFMPTETSQVINKRHGRPVSRSASQCGNPRLPSWGSLEETAPRRAVCSAVLLSDPWGQCSYWGSESGEFPFGWTRSDFLLRPASAGKWAMTQHLPWTHRRDWSPGSPSASGVSKPSSGGASLQ